MRLKVIILLIQQRSAFEIACEDKDNSVCQNADCSSPIGRLVCPKSCGLCSSGCHDTGQHCDVVDCDDQLARRACRQTCNACGESTGVMEKDCIDKSSFCSPTLCGEWSRAMEDCRKTCHPECRYQILEGFIPPTKEDNEVTTEWYTTTETTTTTTTTTTTKPIVQLTTPDNGKCKCLDPDSGRSFDEMSILKVETSPGCSIRLICGSACTKLYKLPEHCVSTTTSTTSTTTSTTTTTTTTKMTTQRTTLTTTQLPTIASLTRKPVQAVKPTNQCIFGDTTLAINHYHFVNNCEYIQCVYDMQLAKPFIYLRNGCHASTRLTVLSCMYNNIKLTVGEVITNECGIKCNYHQGNEQATLQKYPCYNYATKPSFATTRKPSTTRQTTARRTTRTTRPRTTKPRTTRRTTTRRTTTRRTTRPRTTRAPRTKKPKRITGQGKWKRMCRWQNRNLRVGHYRPAGKCRYVHCTTHANYDTAVIFLYENDCNMPANPGKVKKTTTRKSTTTARPSFYNPNQYANSWSHYPQYNSNPYANYNQYIGQQIGQQGLFDEKKVRNYYEKQMEKQMKQEFNKMYKNFMSGIF